MDSDMGLGSGEHALVYSPHLPRCSLCSLYDCNYLYAIEGGIPVHRPHHPLDGSMGACNRPPAKAFRGDMRGDLIHDE